MHTLTIRYADPDTTPGMHKARGYGMDVPMIQPHVSEGWWVIVSRDRDALVRHVNRALSANDVNAYAIRS